MDRQDIDEIVKPTQPPKNMPPKMENKTGIYDSGYEDTVDSTMGQYRGGIERVQDNYNFNVEMFNKGNGLGGELEYIFNRDKYELWD